MKIAYCYKWSRHGKHPIEIWDESRAPQAHEKRELYTVLVGDPQKPHYFLEISNGCVAVEFLDDRLREQLVYSFQPVDQSGRLFLSMMVTREFIDYLDKVRAGTGYYIDPDGKVRIVYERFVNYLKTQNECHVDPSSYWEAYPEFGKYINLVQERPIPYPRVEEG